MRRSDFEVLVDACAHDDGCAVGQFHHLRVAHPVGGRDDDFIACAHEAHDDVADTLFGAVGATDLVGCVVKSVFILQFGHDGIAQRRITGYGRIAGIVLVDGFLGSLFDVVGSVEVRFTHTEVDDIHTLGFQFITLL